MANPYICPRCGHISQQKSNMRVHLYRVRLCSNKFNLELTDEIREIVLTDHIYHSPVPDQPSSIINSDKSIIVNYNTQQNIMNIIGKMDIYDKLDKMLEYHHHDTIHNLWFSVGEIVSTDLDKLKHKCPNYIIKQTDIHKVIEDVSLRKSADINKMNVLYDKKLNTINLYMTHRWNAFMLDAGVFELMKIVQDTYLDEYEQYLIKMIYNENVRAKGESSGYETHLLEYYRFIANFDLIAYFSCTDDRHDDHHFLGYYVKENNHYYLHDHYSQEYSKIKKQTKKSQKTAAIKHVADIIKKNTIQNIERINKDIFDAIKMDDNFKIRVLGGVL